MLFPRPTLKEEHFSPDVSHGVKAAPTAFLERRIWTGTREQVTAPGGERMVQLTMVAGSIAGSIPCRAT